MKKIFIDPGHGGTDPGAVGNGLQEKDITLSIALQLKKVLTQNYENHTLKLSRETDRTVSLRERTTLANNWQADYLLSIHVNAGGGVGFESFIYNNPLYRRSNTKALQATIHREIVSMTEFVDRGMKQANFHMLRESRMPALLTENGFIDHVNDALMLKDKHYIKKIAEGHAKGLAIALHLPRRSTTHPQSDSYRVKKGETLWSIANHLGTTVSSLLQLNDGIEARELPIGYELAISRPNKKEHIIQKGETLWSLAITYNTTVKTLKLLNPHVNPSHLTIGEKIRLP